MDGAGRTDAAAAASGDGLRARRTLLLASSGSDTLPLMRRMVPRLTERTMAFIPAASYVEPYGAFTRATVWRWRLAGIRVKVVDLTGEPSRHVLEELESCDLLYVCGGNSFYLMDCLHRSGAVGVIRGMVARGVPYVGESAGAVVASRDIAYIAPMDEHRAGTVADTRGLGLTAYRVVPHVDGLVLGGAARRILAAHAGDRGFVGLHNDQVLAVRGQRARVVTTYALMPLAL